MQRPCVLHRDERVALEHEAGHAHHHREHVVIERFGGIAEESPPDIGVGAKAECAGRIEPGREDRLHQAAALEAQHAPIIVTAQGHRQREPRADDAHLAIGVETFLKSGQPGVAEHWLRAGLKTGLYGYLRIRRSTVMTRCFSVSVTRVARNESCSSVSDLSQSPETSLPSTGSVAATK